MVGFFKGVGRSAMSKEAIEANIVPLTEDIYLVDVPIPSPLRQVNCYLVRGSDRWTVVDTGFNLPLTQATWLAAFRQLSIQAADVENIIVTHHHPDHYGAAGWLQQLTGAPVFMHRIEARQVEKMWQYEHFIAAIVQFYARHGIPRTTLDEIVPIALETMEQLQPAPKITAVETGDIIPVGSRWCKALAAPGHSPGLLLLWDEADGVLFANDMILDPITPNISAHPFTGPDPLADYLASLHTVEQLPARLTLTGHRQPITDLARRCRQLKEHHRERLMFCLAEVQRLCATGAKNSGQTQAWSVAQAMFGDVMLNSEASMFALGEATAHLDHLALGGKLFRFEANTSSGSQVFYAPKANGQADRLQS